MTQPTTRGFLLDQSSDGRLRSFLRERGHDVTHIGTNYPSGLPDNQVLDIAHLEVRVLITDDRDFGELIFVHGKPHAGVIFLRLGAFTELPVKIERLDYVLTHHANDLDQFLVVSRHRVRIRRG